MDRLLKLAQVLAIIPVGKTSWYQGIKEGRFPQPVSLGGRSRFWKESDILLLIENSKVNAFPK